MASVWLIDKSALTRLASSADAILWAQRIDRGLVRVAGPTLLELGFSARSSDDWDGIVVRPPVSLMPVEYATPWAEDRALEVQRLLAAKGHHRGPSVADLLVAAVAERAGLTVLHVDKDFDTIAAVTGQAVERLSIP